MLKLKFQYWCEEQAHWKRPWYWKEWSKRRRQQQGMRGSTASLTQWTRIWADSGDRKGQGSLACCNPWGFKSWTWLMEWTTGEQQDKWKGHNIYIYFLLLLLPRFILFLNKFSLDRCTVWLISRANKVYFDSLASVTIGFMENNLL